MILERVEIWTETETFSNDPGLGNPPDPLYVTGNVLLTKAEQARKQLSLNDAHVEKMDVGFRDILWGPKVLAMFLVTKDVEMLVKIGKTL